MEKARIIPTIFIALAAFLAVFPILFTVANSFMGGEEIASRYTAEITEANQGDFTSSGIHFVRFGLIPEQPTLEQYRELLFNSPEYLRMFWNSVLLVVPVLGDVTSAADAVAAAPPNIMLAANSTPAARIMVFFMGVLSYVSMYNNESRFRNTRVGFAA